MSSDRIVIAGSVGGTAVRLEINDLIKNDKFFTLYIRALQRMQSTDETKDASFFGVGGIHGQPYVPWNGAVGSFSPGKWNFGGYCTHGSVLFPTWHRPYMLLLEQTIQKHALAVAEQFTTGQEDWKKAATDLRLPFWDWAANSVPPDVVIKDASVTVTDFDGKSISVDNPLIRYRFHGSRPFTAPFDEWPTTLRHPNLQGKEDINGMVQAVTKAQTQITDDTTALLSWIHDWAEFSNHTDDSKSKTNSLESIHDYIHVDIGGSGHMSDPGVAAFDPIFYLHHCNIDRLLSIWSALNQGVGVSTGKSDRNGTFTLAPQAAVDTDTALTPFWNSESTFWESKDVFNTEKFGYTYPEFADIDRNDVTFVKLAAEKVMHNYVKKTPDSMFNVQPDADHIWNWVARIRSKKFELGRSFSVHVFLGDVPERIEHWATSENLVGVHHVFANGAAQHCENCRNNGGIVHEGFIHLNRHLWSKGPDLGSFDPEAVKPYLSDKLKWRVTDTHGQPVDIHSLEVTVLAVSLSRHPALKLPRVGETTFHHDITFGRPGGARHQPIA
ncbi:hypothetical protein AX17_002622 [Amanita inopinata Kibby_2008]|nr:hypothetical protein AX17_002622 [Amanita inopinata Kibby_2008]